MKQLKRLLAVLDPTSDDQPAAEKAVRLAAASGAAVELFVCDYDQHLSGERFFDHKGLERARENIVDRHRKHLAEIAKSLQSTVPGAAAATIEVDARWDNPRDEAILRKLEESGADVLVKDTHYHNVLKRSIFSNTDWSLIRGCRSRLLLVKPRPWKQTPVVVVAVDPTHGSDRPAALDKALLAEGAALAATTGGKLHVFHACDAASAYAVSADSIAFPVSVPVRELADSMRQHHREAMADLLKDWQYDGDYTSHFVEGEIREALIGLIEEIDADVVVMGAVARSTLQRMFLGSTAERVLDHLPCDLLVVKPADEGKAD